MFVYRPLARDGLSLCPGAQTAHLRAHRGHCRRPHTSLPEVFGGGATGVTVTLDSDTAFTLYGLLRIGLTAEAGQFMHRLEARCHELKPDGSLQIVYGIDGRHTLSEETLDHLDGYKGSRPVRVGNGAYNQLQLDIYGELMDSVYLYNKYGSPIS